MRQAGRGPPKHPDGGMGNSMQQQQQQHLHGMFDDNGPRSMGMPSSRGAPHPHSPSHAGMSAPHINMLTVMGELPEPPSPAAAAAAVAAAVDGNWQQGGPPPPMPGDGKDMNRSVNPVDIGIKVANEIMGLHSQAAATGRALEESTRQAEFLQEENERLKEELERVHQARQASDDEAARLKAKLSQRSIELLVLEQKVQAAEERTEAQAQKTAEQAESTVAANERYDALVSRLMVVVVKASVAAEQLEKAMLSANKTPGMRCNCKPALHHGLDALTSLADFRDTWMSGSTMNLNMPYSNSSSNSPAAAAAQSAAGSPRVAAGSSMRRSVMGKESGSCMDARPIRASNSGADSPLRPGSGSSSPMSRHANNMRASMSAAGELTRQATLRPAGGSGELERGRQSSGLRPAGSGEIRSSHRAAEAQLRSCEVPRLHLAMMQQQEQQQRAARESSGCYDSPRRMVGRSGISLAGGGSGTSSPRRSPACLSKTEALEAAADLVYGTLVREQHQHQHQQLRQPMSPSRSPTAARQPPPPWNSGRSGGPGSLPRRFSQAANTPSSPSKVGSQRRTVYFEDDRRGPVVYEPDEYEEAYEEDFDDYLVPSGGPQLAPDRSCMSGWY